MYNKYLIFTFSSTLALSNHVVWARDHTKWIHVILIVLEKCVQVSRWNFAWNWRCLTWCESRWNFAWNWRCLTWCVSRWNFDWNWRCLTWFRKSNWYSRGISIGMVDFPREPTWIFQVEFSNRYQPKKPPEKRGFWRFHVELGWNSVCFHLDLTWILRGKLLREVILRFLTVDCSIDW